MVVNWSSLWAFLNDGGIVEGLERTIQGLLSIGQYMAMMITASILLVGLVLWKQSSPNLELSSYNPFSAMDAVSSLKHKKGQNLYVLMDAPMKIMKALTSNLHALMDKIFYQAHFEDKINDSKMHKL